MRSVSTDPAEVKTFYRRWSAIKSRCTSPACFQYKDYGARGIKLCDEWMSFRAFEAWAISSGYSPGLEIDRIDNNGNYEPGNCRWVTTKQNCRNKRNNKRVTAFGETKLLCEWAEDARCVVTGKRLKFRIWRGWNPEDAITRPMRDYPIKAKSA